jgi:hypothetical protein
MDFIVDMIVLKPFKSIPDLNFTCLNIPSAQ